MYWARRLFPVTRERVEAELLKARSTAVHNTIISAARAVKRCGLSDADLSGFKPRPSVRRVTNAHQILSRKEFYEILKHVQRTEPEAALAIMWDGALRWGELSSIRYEDLTQDQYGYIVLVRGKTGERAIRLVESVGFLNAWLRKRGDSPGRIFAHSRSWLEGHLKRAAQRAGIKKRVYLHLLRHSRLTYLAKRLPRQALVKMAGWVDETNMDRVYVHLAESDVDAAILSLYGLQQESDDAVRKCPRCGFVTPLGSHCANCGALLDITAEDLENLQLDVLMARLLQHPRVRAAVKEALPELLPEVFKKQSAGKTTYLSQLRSTPPKMGDIQ